MFPNLIFLWLRSDASKGTMKLTQAGYLVNTTKTFTVPNPLELTQFNWRLRGIHLNKFFEFKKYTYYVKGGMTTWKC